jgi:hypothetical protein
MLTALLILIHPGFALAQDANDDGVSEQSPPTIPNIAGCWQGNAFNDSQGNTQITFFFAQKQNKLVSPSTLGLGTAVSVQGGITGTVKSTKVKFHGNVSGTGFGCGIKGTGFFQSDNSLSGKYRYHGACFEHQFTSGEFSKVVFIGATCP